MIVSYVLDGGCLKPTPVAADDVIPAGAVWIDLLHPSSGDDAVIERSLGIEVPTREEMREIEPSSRLYIENGARYMTAALLCGADTDTPRVVDVTFILAGTHLVTVRYDEPRAFATVAGRFARACSGRVTGEMMLVELLEAVVDRTADVLEQIAVDVERINKRIFERSHDGGNQNQRYRAILAMIGKKEGLISSVRESLASLARLVHFIAVDSDGAALAKESKGSAKSMSRDIAGLSDYANFLSSKLQFLLDATIGMVSLEQNNIIKIFAVLSVVLMPPTLIASIYGMNFEYMPELHFPYAYPLALVGMVISGILPYVFFKWRGWL